MKSVKLSFFLVLFCLALSYSALAVTPNIRFPKWCKPQFHIQNWNPELKTLTIKISVKANKTPLKDVTSKVFWPEKFGVINNNLKAKKNLALDEKIDFYHSSMIKCPYNGWIQCQMSAVPNKNILKKIVQSQNGANSLASKVLIKEIEGAKSRLVVSKALPVYVRKDIAFVGTKELAFESKWKVKKSSGYYFWYPPESSGVNFTGETLKALRSALLKQSIRTVLKACDLLLNRSLLKKKSVKLVSKGSTFYLPVKTLANLVRANKLSAKIINGIKNKNKNIEMIRKEVEEFPPSFSRGFVYANFATACHVLNKNKLSKEYYQKALVDIPAWPKVKNWLEHVK